jgi:hypothetical protein
MTNSALLLAGQRQPPGRPGASSGGSKAASPPTRCDVELASGPARAASPPSDLAPGANTFIKKLFMMVTQENQDIISFTKGACVCEVLVPALASAAVAAGCGGVVRTRSPGGRGPPR